MKYKFPLHISNFTWLDRLKICGFFLNPNNYWSYGKRVQEFELKMASYVGSRYSIFVSSGSTANTILGAYLRDTIKDNRNIVVFPSTTWATSISPFLIYNFIPQFIDISLENFGMDLYKLEDWLKDNHSKVACVFITSLLGFAPDFNKLKDIENKYNVRIMLDNCEGHLTHVNQWEGRIEGNISKLYTSTTSTYVGHFISSIEGGFIFTNSAEEYEYFLMARNHGMTRSLLNTTFPLPIEGLEGYSRFDIKHNPKVDPRFDFNIVGNNYRNSDVHALIGLLDFRRVKEYETKRLELYQLFRKTLNGSKFYLPPEFNDRINIPFSLPIISRLPNKEFIEKCKKVCELAQIETRPIISGALYIQEAFKKYFPDNAEKTHINSSHLHHFGFYVGLYPKLKKSQVLQLTKTLNYL